MPNTTPNTLDAADLADKLTRAKGRAWCDHAFFIGAAEENADKLGELELLPGCARSEEHTSELQSLMRISYAVFCLKKKKIKNNTPTQLTNYTKQQLTNI